MPENVSATPPSVMPLIGAFIVSRLIYLAAELGIADLIASGSDTTADLAQKTRTHASSLFRMMRALCAYGVFEELAPGRFGLGPMGAQLQSEGPGSVRNFARFLGDQRSWKCLGELEHTLRTGETGMKLVFGTTGFEYLAFHPAEAEIFNAAMADVTRNIARLAIAGYDFSRYRVILDVGGGNGAFLAEVLRHVSSATGMLFDVPAGLTEAQDTLLRAGVANRCTVVAGDFLQSVPSGADLMILKSVIHNWDDQRSILSRCRTAALNESRLLLMERLMPDRMTASATNQRAATLDMRMLAVAGGRERTENEYRTMLADAGFTWERSIVLPAPLDQCMIEAVAN